MEDESRESDTPSLQSQPPTENKLENESIPESPNKGEEKFEDKDPDSPTEVTWEGDSDPENPHNWPKWKKW